MLKTLVIFNILCLVSSLCFLREDHEDFLQNLETMNENLDGDFFKNSNEVYHDLGYEYCKCKEESSEFLTSFCLSILEGYYSRNRKMLSGIGSGAFGAYNRGRYHLYIIIRFL